jgi:hypothetical protein
MDIETFERAQNLRSSIKSLKAEMEYVSMMPERKEDQAFNEVLRIAVLSTDQLIRHAEREFENL